MKEYKRCKYCSMEMDKSAIKCPHCKKVQASKFSFGDKSENLLVVILIIVAIIVGFSSKFSNIQSYITSLGSSFDFPEIAGEFKDIVEFFTDDDEYYIGEVYVEDIVSEFEEDCEGSYDYYDGSIVDITGDIVNIENYANDVYIYLNTGDSSYSICIYISTKNTYDIDYIDSLNVGDSITYHGEFYMDSSDDYEIYLTDGYID